MPNCIVLNTDQMRRIARYELTFKNLVGEANIDEYEIICPEVYSYQLEDIVAALRNLQGKNPTLFDFYHHWYKPLRGMTVQFDIKRAIGFVDRSELKWTPPEVRDYDSLRMSDEAQFCYIYFFPDRVRDRLEKERINYAQARLSDVVDIDRVFEASFRYMSNRDKPIMEWDFSDDEKWIYIQTFQYEYYIQRASEGMLALARKFVDDLCEKDNDTALIIKACSCYGGNRLYECDWEVARECLTRIYKRIYSTKFAEMLGDIYYYGRCSNGVPDYEKANECYQYASSMNERSPKQPTGGKDVIEELKKLSTQLKKEQ